MPARAWLQLPAKALPTEQAPVLLQQAWLPVPVLQRECCCRHPAKQQGQAAARMSWQFAIVNLQSS